MRGAARKELSAVRCKKVHLGDDVQERHRNGYAAECRLTGGKEALKTTEQVAVLSLHFGSPPSFRCRLPEMVSRPDWLCLPVLVSAAVPGRGSLRCRAAQDHSKSTCIRPQCRT